MRCKSTISQWVISLIIGLIYPHLSSGQDSPIPLNSKGLHVISTVKVYKTVVKASPLKRMVAVKNYVNPLITDFQYATTENFTKEKLYTKPAVYLRLEAALAIQKVQEALKPLGLTLLFFDAYRPYAITEKMWEIVPDERYAANPARGSGHNRGAAVDVTMANLVTLEPVKMPTAYDDFSEKAHHSANNLEKEVMDNRRLLRSVMESNGFVALETEWWHYSLPNAAKHYELMNLSFKQMESVSKMKFCQKQ